MNNSQIHTTSICAIPITKRRLTSPVVAATIVSALNANNIPQFANMRLVVK